MQSFYMCDGCGKKVREDRLKDIKDLFMRVSPGGPLPAGECPACGALCYSPDINTADFIYTDEEDTQCEDCGATYEEHDDLVDMWKVYTAVGVGGMMPAGKCPKCNGLCFPIKEQ